MAGQSISAHADTQTVATLRMTAAREGRTTSQITASSLKLYLGLPGAVRAALRDVEALGSPEDQHNLVRALGRTVASAQYEVVRRRIAEGMQIDDEERLRTDDDVLDEAVRVTRQSR